jgi:hypothetical protein
MDSSPIEPPVQCQPVVVQCTCCQSVRQNEELDPIGGVFLVLFIVFAASLGVWLHMS